MTWVIELAPTPIPTGFSVSFDRARIFAPSSVAIAVGVDVGVAVPVAVPVLEGVAFAVGLAPKVEVGVPV
jgi:hypothetical protein